MSDLFDDAFVYKHKLACLHKTKLAYELIGCEPVNWELINYIGFYYEIPIVVHVYNEEQFFEYLRLHHPRNILSEKLPEIITPDITQYVNAIIQDAKQKKASDIHIEAYENEYVIRLRRDGLLHIATKIPKHLAMRVITKLKIMAQLDIAERRLPQDGRIKHLHVDLRISSCPTIHGEKLAIRMLYESTIMTDLNCLGFTELQLQQVYKALLTPQGMFIVTGPTGSGKTSTLYAALNFLNTPNKNIISIENPVEINIAGINQINCHEEIGLNFLMLLRTILRQDPDIIMLGEIRDKETATAALQAAQTGHLILTTLHTNSAAATYQRLQIMGIAKNHFHENISFVIAQRLLRTLCKTCKQPNPENVGTWCAVGCELCHDGYAGRIGIFECLDKDNTVYGRLHEQAMTLVSQGITTNAEVKRVLGYVE